MGRAADLAALSRGHNKPAFTVTAFSSATFLPPSLPRLTSIQRNSGYYFAVAAGSFFIQPLRSSCGFCCAAVALEPIPHPPGRAGRHTQVSKFFRLHLHLRRFSKRPSGAEMDAGLVCSAQSRLSLAVPGWVREQRLITEARSLNRRGQQRLVCPRRSRFNAAVCSHKNRP